MRIAACVGLCVAVALSGCNNVVTSKAPLFSGADARGQPQLRPGLWAYVSPKANCTVDIATPADTWDNCAGGLVVRPGELLGWDQPGTPLEVEMLTVVAKGTPAVIQLKGVGKNDDRKGRYIYGGLRATRLDDQGRAIEIQGWQAMCGPPAPDDPTAPSHPSTLAPLKGLTMNATGGDCTAAAQGPVRESARQSEAWNAKGAGGDSLILSMRWVRDAEK